MTLRLALMLATIHHSPAYLSAIECASPSVAVLLYALFTALNVSRHLPAIASRLHLFFTCAAKPLMTGSHARMLAARHGISTDLTTAPTRFVICLGTLSRARLLPTETALLRAHMRTRRTRASMTNLVTGVRTRLRKHSFSSTRLPA